MMHRHDYSVQTVKDINTADREKSSKGHENSTDKNQRMNSVNNSGGRTGINLSVACDTFGHGIFLQKQHPFTSHLV